MVTNQELQQLYLSYFGKPREPKAVHESTPTGRMPPELPEAVIYDREPYQDEVMMTMDFSIAEARVIIATMQPDTQVLAMALSGHMTVCFPDSKIAAEYEKGRDRLNKWAAEVVASIDKDEIKLTPDRSPAAVAKERRQRLLGKRGRW